MMYAFNYGICKWCGKLACDAKMFAFLNEIAETETHTHNSIRACRALILELLLCGAHIRNKSSLSVENNSWTFLMTIARTERSARGWRLTSVLESGLRDSLKIDGVALCWERRRRCYCLRRPNERASAPHHFIQSPVLEFKWNKLGMRWYHTTAMSAFSTSRPRHNNGLPLSVRRWWRGFRITDCYMRCGI